MPAIGFKSDFVPAILAGLKPLTMRRGRRGGGDPRVGDPLYLFENWRTPQMRKFATATCYLRLAVRFTPTGLVDVKYRGLHASSPPIMVSVGTAVAEASGIPGSDQCKAALQRLAEWDGMASWEAVYEFHLDGDRAKGRRAKYGSAVDRELIGFAGVVAVPGTTPALPL